MNYNIDKKLYILTSDEVLNELGHEIKSIFTFIENDSDTEKYLTKISRVVTSHIKRLGPKQPGTKNVQRKHIIDWLLFKNNNNEQNDIKELMFEYVNADVEGQAHGLMSQTENNGILLTSEQKKDLRFTEVFKDILNSSILGSQRYAIYIPQDEFEVGY